MQRLKSISEPGVPIYLLALAVFAVAAYFVNPVLAEIEGGAVLFLVIYALIRKRKRKKELQAFLEDVTYHTDSATSSTLLHFPLPMAAVRLQDGMVMWGNGNFWNVFGFEQPAVDRSMQELLPGFSLKWLGEGKDGMPELQTVGDRKYKVSGHLVRSEKDPEDYLAVTYWEDVTDYEATSQEYKATRPVTGIIIVDNYDELMKPLTDRQRTELGVALDDAVEESVKELDGVLRRVDRDRYLFIFEKRHYDRVREEKFPLVEKIHEVKNLRGDSATVSVGIGIEGSGYGENYSFASLAADMALARGGDQAVVKNIKNFEFFGGRDSGVETRTKVRSRVAASALGRLIRDARQIYIMGHSFTDLDSVGSATGLVCLCRKLGVPAHIVMDETKTACPDLVASLKQEEIYRDVFISPQDAMVKADGDTLLVVVDTNRPEQVEDRALLESCINRTAVIDHHRRAATYIENAAVLLHEPTASSTGELVTEVLQELIEPEDLLPAEADAVLAGIVLDTKSFTIRAGERTFDAASWLRRAGADPSRVKAFFKNTLDDTLERYEVMQQARLYRDVAVAVSLKPVTRIIASQAADELLNVQNVTASIVLFPTEDGGVTVSARSVGKLNVQLILEPLGGGGNHAAAGVQMKDITIRDAVNRLFASIDEYYDAE